MGACEQGHIYQGLSPNAGSITGGSIASAVEHVRAIEVSR